VKIMMKFGFVEEVFLLDVQLKSKAKRTEINIAFFVII
jgi:hypothetical protein